mmetsp:Transcript_22724/g.32564  ORF Transcript_22724/g.32564 Transcript_22724/m.32564 type:complete len:305 (+) Transcript_22724:72-986(+)
MMNRSICWNNANKAIAFGRLSFLHPSKVLVNGNNSVRFMGNNMPPKEGLPTVEPYVKSDKEPYPPASDGVSMMPWEGWFSSLLKSKLGNERYDKLRKLVLWTTEDIHNLHGAPNPTTRIPISKDGKLTAQYRYPSPGNRKPVQIPGDDPGSDPYFIAHYVRDTTRRGTDPAQPFPELDQARAAMLPKDDPRVQELKDKLAAGPGSSPGNKGVFATGKTDYDPTGLRASMSTSWEATNASLDTYEPNHLPTPIWADRQEEIIARFEAKGLPVPPGEYKFGTVPLYRRVARWGSGFGGDVKAEQVP